MKLKSIFHLKGTAKRIFASIVSIVMIASAMTVPMEFKVKAAEAVSLFTNYQPVINEVKDESGFRHPGVGLTKDILENMRDKVRAQKEPWNTYFNQTASTSAASKTVTSRNQSGSDPTKPNNTAFDSQSVESLFITDALNAYTQAIMYYTTGDEVYRANALHLIRIWSRMDPTKYRYYTDGHIHAGIPLNRMVNAAEILRYTSIENEYYTYSDGRRENLNWTEQDTTDFTNNLINPLIDTVLYDNSHFMNQHTFPLIGAISGYIFTGNKARYDEAVEWFTVNKTAVDQGQNGSIKQLFRLVDTNDLTGEKIDTPLVQLVEMGREQAHGALDLTNAEIISRLLDAQGTRVDPVEGTVSTAADAVSTYDFLDYRFLKAADYFAKYMLGYDTPWVPTAAHTDEYGNPTIIYKVLSAGYRGRLIKNNWGLYYYYKYKEGLNMEEAAPYFSKLFDKRLSLDWGEVDGGGDYWLYIPGEAEAEWTQSLPKAITDPVREIEDRYTSIEGNSTDSEENGTSFVSINATEQGAKIAVIGYGNGTKSIGFRIRTNGTAKMELAGGIDDSLSLPNTNGQWRYVTYTMNTYQSLGDMLYIKIIGAGTIVDIDHININAGALLTPPEFKAGKAAANIFAYVGSQAEINYDFSATDKNAADTVTYQIDDKPEGAVIDENSGQFSWKPEQTGTYTMTVSASDGNSVSAKEVKIFVTDGRQSAVEKVVAPYDADAVYVSSTLDNYNRVYDDLLREISGASDEAFYQKLSELNMVVTGLKLVTPLLKDGSFDYVSTLATSTFGDQAPNLIHDTPDDFVVYTRAASGLQHIIDFGPDFKVSADAFQLQVRASFPERIGGVTVFGSNDNFTWTRLTPGMTIVSEDMQTLPVDDGHKNEQYRFIKMQMIEPPLPSNNMFELAEFRIFGERHEIVNKLQSVSISSDQSIKSRTVLGSTVKLSFRSTEQINNVKVNIQGQNVTANTTDNINWTAFANCIQAGAVNFSINYKTAAGVDAAETLSTTDGSKILIVDESDLINNITGITNLIDPTTTPGRPSAAVTLGQVNALFDGNMNTASDFRNGTNGAGGYITFDFKSGNQAVLSNVEILARQDQVGRIGGVVVQGSNNNSSFTTISTTATSTAEWQNLTITSSTPYRYIRIYNGNAWYGNMSELRFHGRIISPLKDALEQAAAADRGIYTSESLLPLEQAIAEAEALAGNESASQGQIDTAVNNILTALQGLQYITGMPVLESLPDRTAIAGNKLTFTVHAVNADNGIEYEAVGLPAGATFDTASQAFEWTPGKEQGGLYYVTFTARAGDLSSSRTIKLKVIGQPIIEDPGTVELTAEQTFTYKISASEPSGEPLFYSADGLPAGAVFNTSTGVLTWTPLQADYGSCSITFTAGNGSYLDSKVINLNVRLHVLPAEAYTKGSYYLYMNEMMRIESEMSKPGADRKQLASQIPQAEGQLVSIGTLPATKIDINSSMVTASSSQWPGSGTPQAAGWRAFDGDTSTFTDCTENPAWILVDFGSGNSQSIGSFRFYPRSGYIDRVNGKIEGSNDGETFYTLYNISGLTNSNTLQWYQNVADDHTPYRYIRYYSPNGNANVSELEFYGMPRDISLLTLLIDKALELDTGLYSEEDITALNTAVSGAESVYANENATQAEIDVVAHSLQTILENLLPGIKITFDPAEPNGLNGWYTSVPVTTTLMPPEYAEYSLDAGATWNRYSGVIKFQEDGVYELKYRLADIMGNISTTTAAAVKIDTRAPATTATVSGIVSSDGTYNSYTELVLAAEDGDGGSGTAYRSYSLDGISWLEYIGPVILTENGIYNISYRSADNAGNLESVKNISITIAIDPDVMTQYLINKVDDMSIDQGIKNSLTVKLDNALTCITKGDKYGSANKLGAFKNEVNAQRGKKLTIEQADELNIFADKIIAAIESAIV